MLLLQWSLLLHSKVCYASNPPSLLCSGHFCSFIFKSHRALLPSKFSKILHLLRLSSPGGRCPNRSDSADLYISTMLPAFLGLPSKLSYYFDTQMFALLFFLPLLGYKYVETQPHLFCICLFTTGPNNYLVLVSAQ